MIKNFVREKRVYCGKKYEEVDIIPRNAISEKVVKEKRGKRIKESQPAQKNLNDRNSKRYLVQLGNGNFGKGDYHVTLTYDNENLPETIEEAEKQVSNYILRIKRYRKKLEIDNIKYILVTEYKFKKNNEKLKRIHHHIIMNGGVDRNIIEDLWSKRRRKGEREGRRIGYVNADRIQINENGIEALCKYIIKDPSGKKRWTSSRNLIRPESVINDRKFSKRKIERVAKSSNLKEEMQKFYPKHNIVNAEAVYYELTGWHIYLKMWKKRE